MTMNNIIYPPIQKLQVDRYARVAATGIGLPDRVLTNQEVIDRYHLFATDRAIQYTLGIKERRWVGPDEKLVTLMARAVNQCLERADIDIEQVDRVIYTKLLGDYQVPASSVGMLRELGVAVGIPAFDISAACSGFMHALDLALRFIGTGDDHVLILAGGITSGNQNWDQPDPKTVFMFGDAVTAMLLEKSDTQHFFASYLLTNHPLYYNAYIPEGSTLLDSNFTDFSPKTYTMQIPDGRVIHNSVIETAKVVAERLLQATGLTIDQVDCFITSEQNTRIWEGQLEALGIPKEKSESVFWKYGNTVGAMSPLMLEEMITLGRLKRGMLVMMMAHGAGASSGGCIFRY
ncbi:MAG TPA: ketoacyl-ACP synthase III [Bacillota bacterium]|nr:ketoacyl-ACP synthase III [Bacillota bacterium]